MAMAWRIGANTDTLFETSLANLTQDVAPLAIHFGNTRTQTWLLVRLPEPAPAGQPQKLPEGPQRPHRLQGVPEKPKNRPLSPLRRVLGAGHP